jgi:hypothetical protein
MCAPALCQQMKPVSEGPDDRVNFPSNFQVAEGWDFFVSGEYLFWTADEGGLYFAQTGFVDAGAVSFDGTLKKIDPKWKSGARIEAGFNFPKEGSDVVFGWTWFSTDDHQSATSASGNLLPLWAEPDFAPFTGATSASGKWHLNLNVFDFAWGRSSWFGGCFSLRPFFGLRGAWIDQNLKTHFTYATSPAAFGFMRSNANFHGGGMRAGADARFALPCGFAVYGLASGSLLYGQTNGNLRVKEDGASIAHTKDRFWKGISSLQLGLGFGWDTHFAKDRLHIEFHAGWESNLWFSVNQMNHFMGELSTGSYFKENNNLSMQGLVAGGRFDF